MGTALAFDFGMRHIGVACGSLTLKTATPLKALRARDGIPDPVQLEALFAEWRPQVAVVGLPLNMDGSEQELTRKVRRFGKRLKARFGVTLCFVDERLTSVSAREEIFAREGFRALKKGKERLDCASAAEILEQYFAAPQPGSEGLAVPGVHGIAVPGAAAAAALDHVGTANSPQGGPAEPDADDMEELNTSGMVQQCAKGCHKDDWH